jgi:tetratricopeptide (TPR) repeat protein
MVGLAGKRAKHGIGRPPAVEQSGAPRPLTTVMPHFESRSRWLVCCLLGALAVIAHTPAVRTQTPEIGARRVLASAEFPVEDAWSNTLLNAATAADDLDRRLAAGVADPDLPELLAYRERHAEALDAFERIVDARPDLVAEALDERFPSLVSRTSLATDYRPRLAALLERAGAALQFLPREQAALTARRLIDAAAEANRPDRAEVERQLRAFVDRYRGTEAALFTEVDLFERGRLTPASLEALGAFAASHPGTTAAAKAMHQVGFHLANNNSALGVTPRGGDPTARFLRVVAIVEDLRSGRYPDCQWVRNASRLLTGFSFAGAVFSDPANIEIVLSHYRALARLAAEGDPDLAADTLSYLVNTRIGDLLARSGDRLAGVEAVYDDLSRTGASPTRVRFEKALMYTRARREPDANRADLTTKATDLLRAINEERVEPYSRRALATLANLHASDGEFVLARATFEEYIREYPDSDYAWSARIALGRTALQLADVRGAAEAFGAAAAMPNMPDVARVVSLSLASEARVELGDVEQALRDATAALKSWDDRLGYAYTIEPWGDSRLQPLALYNARAIEKATIERRVEALTLAAASPGGSAVEQARRLVVGGRLQAAIALLDTVLPGAVDSPIAVAARSLRTEARLRQVLALTHADAIDRRPDEAIRQLEAFDATPRDFPTLVGRMALATLVSFRNGSGDRARADEVLRTSLDEWVRHQPPMTVPAPDSLEADVAAIRTAVFRPRVDGIYDGQRWNGFTRPLQLPPFMLVNPDVLVRTADGTSRRVSVRAHLPGFDSIIFVDRSSLELLATAIIALGGTAQGTPVSVMQPPNIPIGAARGVIEFWNRYFAMRPGHWGGWEFETYPVITRIEFLDAERTRAAAHVTIGFGGTAVMVSKIDGQWRATGLSGRWVT